MKQFHRRYLWFAFPFVLCFLAVYVAPFLASVYYSLVKSSLDHSFVGFDNFRAVIGNAYFRLALLNTLRFVGVSIPLHLSISLLLALAFYEMDAKRRKWMGAFVLPMLIPSVSVVLVFRALFVPYTGVLTPLFERLGIGSELMPDLSVYAMFLWKNVGLTLILFTAAIQMIPREQYEAAMLDGADAMKRHMRITLPQITPTLFLGVVISIVYALRVFKETYLLYGAYPGRRIYFVQNYMNNHFFKLNYQLLTASAMIFALVVCAALAGLFALERKASEVIWR